MFSADALTALRDRSCTPSALAVTRKGQRMMRETMRITILATTIRRYYALMRGDDELPVPARMRSRNDARERFDTATKISDRRTTQKRND